MLDPRNYHDYPDVKPFLDRLRGGDYRLGLISNFDTWLHEVLDRCALTGWFDVVVVSADVGVQKPDPAIFRLACERLGEEPGSCVYVGDSVLSDVEGAAAAGLRPVLLDRAGRFPDHRGARLASLVDFGAGTSPELCTSGTV